MATRAKLAATAASLLIANVAGPADPRPPCRARRPGRRPERRAARAAVVRQFSPRSEPAKWVIAHPIAYATPVSEPECEEAGGALDGRS